ncbi:MAG: right-handed parallel beta-helix repeat-containing protein, partial [Chitinophagaceae bacterium]
STPQTPTPPAESGSGGLTGGTNYYFSSTTGDDNRSASQAQNSSTPWRTTGKANAVVYGLRSGDALLFKRGETFPGGLNINAAGVIVSAYGSGAKPIITGFATLSNWYQVSSGVWEAPCAGGTQVNMVTINNTFEIMGRWPNYSDKNNGYLTYEGHSGNSTIYDNEIPLITDWRGAELVIRKNRWVLDRNLLTGYSSNSFTYNSASPMPPTDRFGYFIQNHPGTLDQYGEWFYDKNSKRLRVYFGSTNPNNVEVKASVVPTLLTIRSVSNVVVDNISFQGANINGAEISAGANNTDVKNCEFLFSGVNGLTANYVNNLVFENSLVDRTNNNAVYVAPHCTGAMIRNNIVRNTGLYPGMGLSNNDALQGIVIQGSGNQVLNNVVENTGYNGIKLLGENIVIKNNYVNQFNLTTDDGGGIYAAGENDKWGRQIIGNIVTNGQGSKEGTDQNENLASSGIYLDDKTSNVDVFNNFVANTSENGVFIHNSHEINLNGNVVYNAGRACVVMNEDILEPNDPVRNIQMYNNVLVAKTPKQYTTWLVTNRNDIAQFGNFDNNYYCRPADDNGTIGTFLPNQNYLQTNYSLGQWKQNIGKDIFSVKSPVSIPYNSNPDDYIRMEINPSTDAKTIALDGNYVDAKYNRYNGSITLQPYTGVVLFKITGGLSLLSTAPAAPATVEATTSDFAAVNAAKLTLNLSPNPVKDVLTIAVTAPAGTKKATLNIHSVSGVAVKSVPLSLTPQNIAVDVAPWKAGTYIVTMVYDNKTITKQFVKL